MTRRPQTRTPLDRVVAVPQQLRAREAFLRAVLTLTHAIHDLHADRTTLAIPPSLADHFEHPVQPADSRRADIVSRWAVEHHLAAPWIESWGIAALRRWEIGAACRDPRCPFGCTAIAWDDVLRAFEGALFRLHDGWFAGDSLGHDLIRTVERTVEERVWGDGLTETPPPLIETPNPLLETQDEFVARARAAYIVVKHELAAMGIASPSRQLESDSGWLVRVHVLQQASVVELETETKVDASVIRKAIKRLARLIDFPLPRPTSRRRSSTSKPRTTSKSRPSARRSTNSPA